MKLAVKKSFSRPNFIQKFLTLLKNGVKVDSILDELKDDDLSFGTCEALVAREHSLKLDIIDMKKIRELQKVIKFLPKLNEKYKSIEEAKKVIDQVKLKLQNPENSLNP